MWRRFVHEVWRPHSPLLVAMRYVDGTLPELARTVLSRTADAGAADSPFRIPNLLSTTAPIYGVRSPAVGKPAAFISLLRARLLPRSTSYDSCACHQAVNPLRSTRTRRFYCSRLTLSRSAAPLLPRVGAPALSCSTTASGACRCRSCAATAAGVRVLLAQRGAGTVVAASRALARGAS